MRAMREQLPIKGPPSRVRAADRGTTAPDEKAAQVYRADRPYAVFFGRVLLDSAVEPNSPARSWLNRSASKSSSSAMERRSRSMSQCVRAGFSSFSSGRSPSERNDSAPHRGHSHTEGMSASAENTRLKWWSRGQS